MNRIAVILLLALSVGCTTNSREELVDGKTLPQQLDAYILQYYEDTINVCTEIHGKAMMNKSKVDCAVSGNAMHLSFPSVEFHNQPKIFAKIQQLEYNWCAAAQSKTGKVATWARHFRNEKMQAVRPCFKGDKLRALTAEDRFLPAVTHRALRRH